MPNRMQDFLAAATQKAAGDLTAALHRLPEDKRAWSPGGKARTALDQVAECALLNGYISELIQTRQWPTGGFDRFLKEKTDALSGTEEALLALLQQNTSQVTAMIQAVPDETLNDPIQLPWTEETVAVVLGYSCWNMTYHEGQINYIASLLADAD